MDRRVKPGDDKSGWVNLSEPALGGSEIQARCTFSSPNLICRKNLAASVIDWLMVHRVDRRHDH